MRVLLIEDDDGDALLVEELLLDASHPVELLRARTLAEGMSLLTGTDCVLLDLQLPDASGLDGLARLRELAPWTAVVVLTGHADERHGAEAVAAGAQDYLLKGQVDGQLVVRTLRYAVERVHADQVRDQLREQRLLARENRRLERGLLPSALLSDESWSFAARYRPGRNGALLGGDFYDAVEDPDGTVRLIVGDVCGHGPDEAALGVCLRIAWRSLVLAGLPTAALLRTLQEVLVHERHQRSIFATACMVTVMPDRARAEFHLAGHPPPLLLGDEGARLMPGGHVGLPLGIDRSATWRSATVELSGRWGVMLYTDGLCEGRVGGGTVRLGHEDMARMVHDRIVATPSWRADPGGVLDELIRAVERLNGSYLDDDVATVILAGKS